MRIGEPGRVDYLECQLYCHTLYSYLFLEIDVSNT